jgi:acetyl/propionyl-CoA carboxylase alpha subunit
VEFLLEPDGRFWFLEMNTRLQVEHPVTELVIGLDLVELQLDVAEGAPLPDAALDAPLAGHAIEVRLTAEDPAAGYRPSTGRFSRFEIPGDVRVDTGIASGSTVSPFYDSMVGKVIAHGATRAAAVRTLADALRRARLHGPVTNRDQLVRILDHPAFRAGELHTGFLDEHPCTDPVTGDARLAAAAAALAEQAANRASAGVLAGIPSGWRNNPAVDQRVELTRDDRPGAVTYRFGRHPHLSVDGEPLDAAVIATDPDGATFDVGGVQRRYEVRRDGVRRFVDAADGHVTFSLLPRHPDPTATIDAGSLVAPMPGNVLRVLVAPGDVVTAGQAMVVIEAMKMEHQIVAPLDGAVEVVHVEPGDQVETGQLLLHVEADGGAA